MRRRGDFWRQPRIAAGVWMRRPTWTLGWAFLSVCGGVFWVYLGLYYLFLKHNWTDPPSTAGKAAVAAFLWLVAGLSFAMAARQARNAVLLSAEGIVVRNVLRTRLLKPQDVAGFVPGKRLAPCPLIQLTHGRQVAVTALSRNVLLKSEEADAIRGLAPLCEQLNAVLATVRSATTGPVDLSGELMPAEAMRRYGSARAISLGFLGVFWAVSLVVVVLRPTVMLAAVLGGLSVAETLGTYLMLRSAKKAAMLKQP